MKRNVLKYTLMAFLWIAYTLPALADGDSPVDPPGDDDPISEPGVPINEWALLLGFAAVAIGIYFAVKQKRQTVI